MVLTVNVLEGVSIIPNIAFLIIVPLSYLFLSKYEWTAGIKPYLFLISSLILGPLYIDLLFKITIPLFSPIGTLKDWIPFYGSYLGGVIGAYLVYKSAISSNKAYREEQDNRIAHEYQTKIGYQFLEQYFELKKSLSHLDLYSTRIAHEVNMSTSLNDIRGYNEFVKTCHKVALMISDIYKLLDCYYGLLSKLGIRYSETISHLKSIRTTLESSFSEFSKLDSKSEYNLDEIQKIKKECALINTLIKIESEELNSSLESIQKSLFNLPDNFEFKLL